VDLLAILAVIAACSACESAGGLVIKETMTVATAASVNAGTSS